MDELFKVKEFLTEFTHKVIESQAIFSGAAANRVAFHAEDRKQRSSAGPVHDLS
jgi:hypothetical protein